MAVVENTKRTVLQGQVRQHVAAGATVHTDALKSYVHNVIDHAEKYVDGQVHTNGCETFWSLRKRSLNGTYVSVEPFHLFRYLDEQAFRFNNRAVLNDADRFGEVVRAIVGRRLTYQGLIGALSAGPLPA